MAYIDFHKTIHEMGDEACATAIIEGAITEFEDASLKMTGNYAFYKSPALISVKLNNLSNSYALAFSECALLSEINTPNVKTFNENNFSGSGVEIFDVEVRATFHSNIFKNTPLKALILRTKLAPCILQFSNHFVGTPIESGNGYIYVPKKMADGTDGIETYEAATNWSVYAGKFRYIEDYPEITGG